MDRLELQWTQADKPDEDVFFWDFVVSGQSLYETFGRSNVSILGSLREEFEAGVVNRLLTVERGDYPSGRVALYVCPLCADLNCGAVSAHIARQGDVIVWSDFRSTFNRWDETSEPIDLRPFHFSFEDYKKVLERLRAACQDSSA